jgi:dipeptidyl aminopeptidase/acylaminoacyl peptidase
MFFAVLCVELAIPCMAQQRRTVTPADCVAMRYLLKDQFWINPIQINKQGSRIAYLVKSPDLPTNKNRIMIYVKDVTENADQPERLLVQGDAISQLQWLDDGRRFAVLMRVGKYVAIIEIDALTGERHIVAQIQADIQEYVIDQNGATAAFSTQAKDGALDITPTASEAAHGYRIPFGHPLIDFFTKSRLFIAKRINNGNWSIPKQVTIHSPFTHKPMTELAIEGGTFLSLSPDGHRLTLTTYVPTDELTPEWKKDLYTISLQNRGVLSTRLTLLYNLDTGETSIPIKTTLSSDSPLWSEDSKSFLIIAQSPVGTRWQQDDEQDHRIGTRSGFHLFRVDISTNSVELVEARIPGLSGQQVLFQKDNDSLLVRTSASELEELKRVAGIWVEQRKIKIPLPDLSTGAQLVSDGRRIIGEYQNAMTPPQLFLFDLETQTVKVIARLDPQVDSLALAPAVRVEWKTSTGAGIEGLLFEPPDYQEGKRYPLVIGTKPVTDGFVCDTGEDHYPSFAPQPLANAGILYLAQYIPPDWDAQVMEHSFPQGYPGLGGYGGLAEAAFQMDVWEKAVEKLDAQGLVDPRKIGMIGFSRSGWYTEFALAHSKLHFKAATAADNVAYSLSEYWLLLSEEFMGQMDAMYGGPPGGDTLKNWLDFSISFNVEKIHTPLLMEEMGYGDHYDNSKAPPLNLADRFETFAALSHMKRPVELYYYPNEDHQPDHPQARLGTLERNLDWYRFWLQGYERPNAEDPDQYKRWEHLRELQDTEDKARRLP